MTRSHTAAAIAAAACSLAAAAPAAVAQQSGALARPKPFFDSRDAERRAVQRRGEESLRAPSDATLAARSRVPGTVEVDPLRGTPRVVGDGAPLSVPAAGDPGDVAMRYVRDHLALLGLTESDIGSFRLEPRMRGAGGTTSVRFSQFAQGVPAFDSSLEVI